MLISTRADHALINNRQRSNCEIWPGSTDREGHGTLERSYFFAGLWVPCVLVLNEEGKYQANRNQGWTSRVPISVPPTPHQREQDVGKLSTSSLAEKLDYDRCRSYTGENGGR